MDGRQPGPGVLDLSCAMAPPQHDRLGLGRLTAPPLMLSRKFAGSHGRTFGVASRPCVRGLPMVPAGEPVQGATRSEATFT